jgi:hypothetical protein
MMPPRVETHKRRRVRHNETEVLPQTQQSTIKRMLGMPQNFIACDREQELLLPPSLREWLPEDHLAWFVLAAA